MSRIDTLTIFPSDFMFQLTKSELADLRSQFATTKFAKTAGIDKTVNAVRQQERRGQIDHVETRIDSNFSFFSAGYRLN